MATQNVTTIIITPEIYQEVCDWNNPLTISIDYYDESPAGYEITASGNKSAKKICPRPCETIQFPEQV